MKRIAYLSFFVVLFISAQAAFGDPVILSDTEQPIIPIILGGVSNKPAKISVAEFTYDLVGEIDSATLSGQWGGNNINKIRKISLYLDDVLLINFDDYYQDLTKLGKKELKRSLKQQVQVPFSISMTDKDELKGLEDEEAILYLEGKPKFFKYLTLDPVSLTIIDPVPMIAVAPVPEPATLLLIGSGLIGLAGIRRRLKK